jgi:D-alanine-D-alanine ligase
VAQALSDLDYHVQILEAGPQLLLELEEARPDAVFNIATSYRTRKDQANIAAMLELSGIPFTGSGSAAHFTGLHKHISKMAFMANNIPTPRFTVIYDSRDIRRQSGLEALGDELSTPVIVKPAAEGSSVGIYPESVTEDPIHARIMAQRLLDSLEPPVLVEEYISGREFTVAVVGYPEPIALPVEEIVFNGSGMYTYDVKARDHVTPICPAPIPEDLSRKLQDIAIRAFEAIGCRDIARVDIRLSQDEEHPFALEINTLPGLMPGYSEVPRIAEAAGISYPELIELILQGALQRKNSGYARPD